jgi:signal peptidase I
MPDDPKTSPAPARIPPPPRIPAAPPTSPAAAPAPRKTSLEQGSNIKETIESILVAFILAFIFRAFVVEAFVIPTGSMAPTLLGAHMRFRCPECGYLFTVNYSPQSQLEAENMQVPTDANAPGDIYCPNCGYRVATRNDAVPVRFGDRILVMKYIYLLHPPKRWDVVVFKAPANPEETHYTQNFIKRLVGKPGEHLMILDGDVFISTDADPTWRIQTRPDNAQDALWRLVYDNDFYPQHAQRDGQFPWVQPWKPSAGSGWNLGTDASNGRQFHFDSSSAAGRIDFDPDANSTTQTISDYLAYDLPQFRRSPGPVGSLDDERSYPVSDLKLSAYYHRTAGDGPFRMILTKHVNMDHTFTAEITSDSIRLLHHTNVGDSQIGPTVKLSDLGLNRNDAFLVEFQNVDYQVTLKINGRQIIQSTPDDFAPNVDWLMDQWKDGKRGRRGEAAIEADSQTCVLDHISLWRDIYYTNRQQSGEPFKWASPSSPIVLGDNEFFVMGDNSEVSADARYWDKPIDLPHEGLEVKDGRVPAQFMLGQAVFVYWPAGFRVLDTHWSIIPDFGDMRWIH